MKDPQHPSPPDDPIEPGATPIPIPTPTPTPPDGGIDEDENENGNENETRLDRAVAIWLRMADAVPGPSRAEFLAKHADLGPQLEKILDGLDGLDRVAAGMGAGPRPPATARARESAPTLSPIAVSAAAPLVPERIRYFGDYELIEEIARGGMGIVYRARQISLDRQVALKMILADSFASADEVRRFRAEASAAASLSHPGIVPIYEVGEHDGRNYYSMKLMDGGHLGDAKHRFYNRSADVAALVETLAQAVHHGHQRGVLHRDLKPSNVLLDHDGRPHVADFGLAKRMTGDDGLTRTGAVIGTPVYMAPEQAAGGGREITVATDVWSLGVILYELLWGAPPFRGLTPVETLQQVLNQPATPPNRKNFSVPRDLETICLKCLEKDPGRRFSSAGELGEDLGRFQRGEPVRARPIGMGERAGRWIRRHPALTALIVVVALGLGLAMGGSAWVLKRERILRAEAEANLVRARALGLAAVSHENATRNRDVISLLLARESVRYRPGPQTLQRLRDALNEPPFRVATVPFVNGVVYGVAISPDGSTLYPYGEHFGDGIGRLFSPAGAEIGRIRGIQGTTHHAEFSPDGSLIVMARDDGVVRLLNVRSRENVELIGHTRPVIRAEFSPDGHRILSASWDESLRLWDLAGNLLTVMRLDQKRPFMTAFSPDGRVIVASTEFESDLFYWTDGAARPTRFPVGGHSGEVRSLEFSADGARLLTGSEDHTARLWDWNGSAFEPRTVFSGHSGGVVSARFTPDGRKILTASEDGTARLWDLDGTSRATFSGHPGTVGDARILPDGGRVLTAGDDRTARLWDLSGRELSIVDDQIAWHWPIRSGPASIAPGGEFILTSPGSEVRIWDSGLNEAVSFPVDSPGANQETEWWPDSAVLSPDGDEFLVWSTGDRAGRLFDLSGRELAVVRFPRAKILPAHGGREAPVGLSASQLGTMEVMGRYPMRHTVFRGHTAIIRAADRSRAGGLFVTGSEDRDARVWDDSGATVALLRGHSAPVGTVAFSADAALVATGSDDGTGRVWTAAGDLVTVLTGHQGPVRSVAFLPDAHRIVTGSADGTVAIWSRGGELLDRVSVDGTPIDRMEVHPDGHRFLAVTAGGAVVAREANDTAQPLFNATVDGDAARFAAFASKSDRILVGYASGSVRVIGLADGATASFARGDVRIRAAIWLAGGERVLLGAESGAVRVWNPAEPGSAAEPVMEHAAAVASLAADDDGGTAIVHFADGSLGACRFEPSNGWNVPGHGRTGGSGPLFGRVFWTETRGRSLVLSEGGVVRWIDREDYSRDFFGHEGDVEHADLSVDGAFLLTASADSTARLWSIDGAEPVVFRGHDGPVNAAVFSPNQTEILTASDDGTAQLWDRSGNVTATLIGHTDRVTTARFSPDNRFLVTGGADRTVRVWDRNGTQKALLQHEGQIKEIVLSPDSRFVLVTPWANAARLWTAGGEPAGSFPHNPNAGPARFVTATGQIATSWQDHVVLWDRTGEIVVRVQSKGNARLSPLFPEDGRRMISFDGNGRVRVSTLASEDLIRLADRRLIRGFNEDERQRFRDLLAPAPLREKRD